MVQRRSQSEPTVEDLFFSFLFFSVSRCAARALIARVSMKWRDDDVITPSTGEKTEELRAVANQLVIKAASSLSG